MQRSNSGVDVGFVDGSIEILYAKIKEKIRRLIEQKISEWQEDDIYAISLYVFDEEDDPRRPVAVLGYNTERQVQKSNTEAFGEQEARWNYAFWLQNDEMCLGRDDTAEDIREWITEKDLWESEDEINSKFVELLVAVVQDIHASGLLKDKFGREIPILIHELEYYEKIARQNIEANGETLDSDFISFCMPYLPEAQNEMQASQNEMSKAAAFIIAIILIMSLFCVLGLIISSRNKANSESAPNAEKDSFFLRYVGSDDNEIEIFFKDCVCEYDRDGIRVYTCFLDDPAVETEGYAICIQSSEKTEDRFSKDYLIDKDAGCIYSLLVEMRDGIEIFTRIQAEAVDGTSNYVVTNTYIMEWLIAEAYGLEYLDNGEDFDCQQVEFTGLYDENGKTVLRGKASAVYNASGKKYSIEWEIDTETVHESAKAYLSDFDIHPLYVAFLQNEISVENPFVPEGYGYDTELTYFDDRLVYDDHFWKSFSLVDVNNDGDPELVFKMYNSPSEVVYILGVQDEKLICYDILETHTTHMSFLIYDNGIVEWGQNYDGEEVRYYTFTEDGKEHELIHFIREADSDSDFYYDYYYLEGNKEDRYRLQGDEEYESMVSSYEGEEPEWFECESFVDIPQNQGISKTEISMPSKQEKTESGQIKWQVYIQPDMPEPFIEVLRQYEQYMNADKQNLNDEDVREKIDSVDGEWRYLYYELCGSWLSAVCRGEEDVIRYSLEDLTDDGYPELVMGYYLSDDTILPEVVYYYSQTEGIKMECLSSYYAMVLYEDSVIEYISGGATYTETFIQFQEETESWQQVACVVVDWDYETDSVRGYYWGDDVSGYLTDNRSMSVEEYQKIIAQYATEPMELEWTPLIH